MDYKQRFVKSLRGDRPSTAKSVNPKKALRDLSVSASVKIDRTMLRTILDVDHLTEGRNTFSKNFADSQTVLSSYQKTLDNRLSKPKHVRIKARK